MTSLIPQRVNELIVLLLILCLTIPVENSIAQENIYFDKLSSQDGLLDDVAYSIFQDSQGYIWIGSMGGLQRYDGYNFVNYTYGHSDPSKKLSQSVVRHIMEDSDGILWVGTRSGGITRIQGGKVLPAITANMKDDHHLADSNVEDIIEDGTGGFWIASNRGLIHYKNDSLVFFRNDPQDDSSLSHNSVFSLLLDSEGQLWVGTEQGLNRLLENGKFQRYIPHPTNRQSFNDNFIHDIFEDSKGNIWVANIFHGIGRYNPSDESFTNFVHDPSDPWSISHDVTLDIEEDQYGNLWIATWGGGLNKFSDGKFQSFVHDPNDPNSIAGNNLEEVMVDRNDNVWTVNYFGGVNKLINADISKMSLANRNQDIRLKDAGFISSITMSPDSLLWVGTFGGLGLIEGNNLIQFSEHISDGEELIDNSVYALHTDKTGRVWVGYGDKPYVEMIEDGKVSEIVLPESFHDQQIWTIASDTNGSIWMGAINWGISVYTDGNFKTYYYDSQDPDGLATNYIIDLHGDNKGNMWIATGDAGLIKFKNGKFTNFRHDPDNPNSLYTNALTAVVTDSENQVWIGFAGGISKFDPTTQQFQYYGEQDGLVGQVVEEFCVDKNGTLWVATHSGASQYDPKSDRFISYTYKDGFVDPNLACLYCGTHSDRVYFGGTGHLHYFQKDQQDESDDKAPLLFSEFNLQYHDNQDLNNSILNELKKKQYIKLNHDQNSFILNFAVLSSEINPPHTYFYRIKNRSSAWEFLGTQNYVSFNFLEPGIYELDIKSKTKNSFETIKSVTIEIAHPWWETLWFQTLLIVAFLVSVASIVYWRIKYLESSRTKLSRTVKEKTAEINDKNQSLEDKIRQLESTQKQLIESEKMASIGTLTAGLAHELNNPLSYIGGIVRPLRLDLEEIGNFIHPDNKEDSKDLFDEIDILLGNMKDGVNKASRIIKNLLDISPNESDFQEQVFDLSEPLEISVNLLSKGTSRVSIISTLPKSLHVFGNQIELNQALLNIIKNGIEATPKDVLGTILIQAEADDEFIEMKLTDNGVGIPKENHKKIFEPFFTTKPPGTATGLGLYITYAVIKKHGGTIKVDSEENKGTTFTVRLPRARQD